MLGSSDLADSETTHKIPRIFDFVEMDGLGAVMPTEDEQ